MLCLAGVNHLFPFAINSGTVCCKWTCCLPIAAAYTHSTVGTPMFQTFLAVSMWERSHRKRLEREGDIREVTWWLIRLSHSSKPLWFVTASWVRSAELKADLLTQGATLATHHWLPLHNAVFVWTLSEPTVTVEKHSAVLLLWKYRPVLAKTCSIQPNIFWFTLKFSFFFYLCACHVMSCLYINLCLTAFHNNSMQTTRSW